MTVLALTSFDGSTCFDFEVATALAGLPLDATSSGRRYIIGSSYTPAIQQSASSHGFRPIGVDSLMTPIEDKLKWLEGLFENDAVLGAMDYPGTSLGILDQIAFDRFYWYVPQAELTGFVQLFDKLRPDVLYLIGGPSYGWTVPMTLAAEARRKNVKVVGVPLGYVSGRNAPQWLGLCDEVIVRSAADGLAVVAEWGADIQVIQEQPLPPPPHGMQTGGGDHVFLDFVVSSPRGHVRTALQEIAGADGSRRFVSLAGGEPGFYEALFGSEACSSIILASRQEFLQILASARQVISFYPFGALNLAQKLHLGVDVKPVDIGRRFQRVDGLSLSGAIESEEQLREAIRMAGR